MKLFNFKKFYTQIRDLIFPPYVMSEDEQRIYNTIENTLSFEETESRIAPISDEYLIFNKDLEMIIVVQRGMIVIANHNYFMSTFCNDNFQTILDTMILDKIEIARGKLKQEMLKNKINLLEKIENQTREAIENQTREAIKNSAKQ